MSVPGSVQNVGLGTLNKERERVIRFTYQAEEQNRLADVVNDRQAKIFDQWTGQQRIGCVRKQDRRSQRILQGVRL